MTPEEIANVIAAVVAAMPPQGARGFGVTGAAPAQEEQK